MTSAYIDLYNTQFVRTLANLAREWFRDDEPLRLGHGTGAVYVRASLVSAGELIIVCDQLKYAAAYMSRYRRAKTHDGALITRSDHVAYEIENFLVRINSVPDRALKLVNIVFQLGIPAKECRGSVITENTHVKRTPVRQHLKALERAVGPTRTIRNQIVHGERYSDEELERWEIFHMLEKDGSEPDPSVARFRNLYKTLADRYVRNKRKELLTTAGTVSQITSQLFGALFPMFEKTHALLSGNSGSHSD